MRYRCWGRECSARRSRPDMLKRFHIAAVLSGLSMMAVLAGSATTRAASPAPGKAHATFAGGCFWCMEGPFDRVPGVVSTTSGYIGGQREEPELRAGLVRDDRPRGGGRDRLRPGQGHLRAAARRLLAQRRSPRRRRPVLRSRQSVSDRRSSFTTTSSSAWPSSPSRPSKLRESSRRRSPPRSCPPGTSTRRRTITRTTT